MTHIDFDLTVSTLSVQDQHLTMTRLLRRGKETKEGTRLVPEEHLHGHRSSGKEIPAR